jgi:hypothetical protein
LDLSFLGRRLGALIAAVAIAMPASAAAPASIDYSDLWFNAAESGWGAELQQQGDVIFTTLFVYGADGSPTWFVAPSMRPLTFVAPAPPTWQGPLYRTTGPAFSGAFDPASVTVTSVGNATFEFTTATTATLRYTVDGTSVVKTITRQTWRAVMPAAGNYNGGMSTVLSLCPEPGLDGTLDLLGPMTVAQAGTRVTLAFSSLELAGLPSRCTFGGDYRQDGRLGTITGTFSCTLYFGQDDRGEAPRNVGKSGNFTLSRIESSPNGTFGKLNAQDQDCKIEGYLGGVRLP